MGASSPRPVSEGFGARAFPACTLGEGLGVKATEGGRLSLQRLIRLFVPHSLTVCPSVGGSARFRRLPCGNGARNVGMNSLER